MNQALRYARFLCCSLLYLLSLIKSLQKSFSKDIRDPRLVFDNIIRVTGIETKAMVYSVVGPGLRRPNAYFFRSLFANLAVHEYLA